MGISRRYIDHSHRIATGFVGDDFLTVYFSQTCIAGSRDHEEFLVFCVMIVISFGNAWVDDIDRELASSIRAEDFREGAAIIRVAI